MKETIKKFHKQNSGSTLVIVLTVVAFISILAVVVTSAAAMNYRMKMVNKQAQSVFYTSENAVDEIYAALGRITMDSFDKAYNDEMANVVRHQSINGHDVSYSVSGVTSNQNMRRGFIYNLVTELGLWTGDKAPEDAAAKKFDYSMISYDSTNEVYRTDIDDFVKLLNTFLEEKQGLEVKSVGKIAVKVADSSVENAGLKTYTVTFNDCVVEYKNENNYYSTLAFDCDMTMPDVYIEFATDGRKGLDSFKDFALIGNTGVVIDDGSSSNLTGSIYAGRLRGLSVGTKSALKSSGGAVNMIVGGDVNVKGTLTASNNALWCTGIITSGTDGAVVNISGNTYVKDDLQIDGDGSMVTVAGNYYGYSYAGMNAEEGNHNNSSAIIINGKNASLSMAGIGELLLSGNAYIDYKNGETSYGTGEGLSLKGSQEIYLVPSYLMSSANPVVGDTADVTVDINAANFFGYRYLNMPTPYTKRTVGGVTYYYLNFKDREAATAYVRALLDDAVYNQEVIGSLEGGDYSTETAYDKSRKYVQDVVKSNLTSLGSIAEITAGNGSTISSDANLIRADKADGSITPSVGDVSGSEPDYAEEAKKLSDRYKSWTTVLSEPDPNIKLSDYAENNVFVNIISLEKFEALVEDGTYSREVQGYPNVLLYASNARTVTIDDEGDFKNYNQGIVVTTGDVVIKKSFSGTVIAGGTITIDGTAVDISNTIEGSSVEDILDMGYGDSSVQEIEDFAGIFEGSAGIKDNSGISLSELTYKDFVEFVNWRKSYEED